MDAAAVVTVSSMVLRKRSRGHDERLVLHLSSPPPNQVPESESDYEPEVVSHSVSVPCTSTKQEKVSNGEKSYICDFEGCMKAYTKPSRLIEHQRTHTGEVCSTKLFPFDYLLIYGKATIRL